MMIGTNMVYAKDIYRVELGQAALERMAVVGRYDTYLEYPPVRGPWENEFCHSVKTNLRSIVGEYLDLRYTNSVGVFTNFYDITQSQYINRFWTDTGILSYCDLPTNFWDYTPARYLTNYGLTNGSTNIVSGYSTTHYGWEGVYRIIKAMQYVHPRPSWSEYGPHESISNGATRVAQGVDCTPSGFTVPSPYDTWMPSVYTSIVSVGDTINFVSGAAGKIEISQLVHGWYTDELLSGNSEDFWGVSYIFDIPYSARPGAVMTFYTNAFFPTGNVADAQAFAFPEDAFTDGTNYYAAALYKIPDPEYYIQAPTNWSTNTFYLITRGEWPIILYDQAGYVAQGTNVLTEGGLSVESVTLNPNPGIFTNVCSTNGFGYFSWGAIDYGSNCGNDYYLAPPRPSWQDMGFTYTRLADACGNDDPSTFSMYFGAFVQRDLRLNVAIQPDWEYR